MSVVKSKRTESKLEVLLVANQIAEYTIRICSNEKSFPKRYRWCLTNKLVDLAMDINNMVQEANAVYVKTARDYQIRRAHAAKGNNHKLVLKMDKYYKDLWRETDAKNQ